MTLARALRLLLALALLVAWQNALVHPLAHVDHDGGLVHLDGGHDDEEGGASAHCDAIAAVAAVIGAGTSPACAADSSPGSIHPDSVAALPVTPLAYRSQAPPQHS